jgi:hypothetical protein
MIPYKIWFAVAIPPAAGFHLRENSYSAGGQSGMALQPRLQPTNQTIALIERFRLSFRSSSVNCICRNSSCSSRKALLFLLTRISTVNLRHIAGKWHRLSSWKTARLANANKSRSHKLPEAVKYSSAKLVCCHFGDKEIRKSKLPRGVRPHQKLVFYKFSQYSSQCVANPTWDHAV